MELLQNGFTLEIPRGCFPLSTDSILLADFIQIHRNERILDLGSGCGTLGLLLCARDENCRITGLEFDEKAHAAALENIRRNHLDSRMDAIHADLRLLPPEMVGSFSCCVSNPPYFSGGEASLSTPLARREDHCSPAELFATAAKALKYGGDFYLVHKPERLAQLCACAVAVGLEPKRLRLIRHKEGGPVSLILLSCRKGGKPGLVWEEQALHHPDGSPTDYYKELYHI